MTSYFKAGVGREIITPPLGTPLYGYANKRPAVSVHDDLKVTAFAFENEKERIIMISADICLLESDEVSVIQKMVSEATGVPTYAITFSSTHTHSGPAPHFSAGWGNKNTEYIETILRPMTVKAAISATRNMRDAVMGVGTVDSMVGVNRREIKRDGTIELGQNPWGVFDKKMTVVSFRGTDGSGIGSMVHYGCHGTAAGRDPVITRDWSGVMNDALERESGMPSALFIGPLGDTGPRLSNGCTVGDIKLMEELGSRAAYDAVNAYKTIRTYHVPEMKVLYGKARLPYKPIISREEAKAKLDELGDPSKLFGIDLKAHEKYSNVIKIYESNTARESYLEFDQMIITIDSVAFVQFPFEIFSEIAIRIARHSPYTHTLSLNNTNGTYAYFPTKSQLPLGGYEVEMFGLFTTYTLVDDADTCMVNESLRLLEEAFCKKS